MKVLVIHNRYLEGGGEDKVVDTEIKLLQSFGHKVIFYVTSNEEIAKLPFYKKIYFLLKDIIWSKKTYFETKELIKKEKPDIAHIHNIFIFLSPSVYNALKEEKIPVVQTLHNYRFLCLNGLFYRENKICEECLGKNFAMSVFRKCWKNSLFLSFFLARMLNLHFQKKTFQQNIDTYIALSRFSREKFIEAGFPPDKIVIKPNFIDLKEVEEETTGDFSLFIGRLVEYKGINTLISAYNRLSGQSIKIIGDGPLFGRLKKKTKTMDNIELIGRLSWEQTIHYMRMCKFLIVPSECYETFGRVIIEAYACGVSVVASNIGAIRELVEEGVTGLLFRPGDVNDLCRKIKYLAGNNELLISMGKNARRTYEEKYTLEKNYAILMEIYKKTIENSKKYN